MNRIVGCAIELGATVVVVLGSVACVAPRAMTQTGRVTPAHEYRAGIDVVGNIPTGTPGAVLSGLNKTVDDLVAKSDRTYDDGFNSAAKAALAYSLDPVSMAYAASLRYGFIERLDAGYKYAAGAHAIDARLQFLGAPGSPDKEGGPVELAGAVGLQYSRQSFDLPSIAGLDKLADLLGFEMKRQDLLVPITLSYPFGGDEQYGAVGFGLVAGYTFLSYGLNPNRIVKLVDGVEEAVAKVSRKQGFATYGGFVNVKAGYKYAYVGLGLATYYQSYGTFELLDKARFELSGWTFVPTLSFEARY